MNYFTDVFIKTMCGRYDWCGNGYDSPNGNGGYYLCQNEKGFLGQSTTNIMVSITIKMSQNLYNSIDIIEIYDCTGFLAQYTVNKIQSPIIKFFFALKYAKPGTDLQISYQKILPKQKTSIILSRSPREKIFKETIKIPELVVKGTTECAICLDEIETDNNKYFSKCCHVFHMDCLWKYLEPEYVKPLTNHCSRYCKHTGKVKPFACPLCRTVLENNY
jgi:hypothetical protein